MKALVKYEFRSPTRVLLEWFTSVPTSSTPVRVVTTGVGYGPCPIPYSRICTPCAQSHGSGSDKPPSSS
jgi:hypothetical protein